MLGSQTWFLALGVPTIVVGGFIASRKRLAYQWREELMDPESNAYPTVTDAEMEFFKRVASAPVVEEAEARSLRNINADALGVPLAKEENFGLRVKSDVLAPAEQNVYLNEVKRWSTELGNAIDSRKVRVFEARVEDEKAAARERVQMQESHDNGDGGLLAAVRRTVARRRASWNEPSLLRELDAGFYAKLRFISDHAEDIQLMRAPWGSGDRLLPEKMPSALRHLVRQVEGAHENLGRLRHVFVEYSPDGKFFREPRTPKAFDGHDYVIVPLRRDGGDAVVTFAPALRSKFSRMTEVMANSWTSRDVDAFVPAGGVLRVSGLARYDWGWGVRPGPVWFGSRLNRINRAIGADDASEASRLRNSDNGRSLLSAITFGLLGRSAATAATNAKNRESHRSGSTPCGTEPFAGTKQPSSLTPAATTSDEHRASIAVKPDAALSLTDAALVVLHFEGPRAEHKQRSLLFQPERLIFGKPPTVEAFEKWVDDRPTREDVQEEGVLRFMVKRYFEMLTVS